MGIDQAELDKKENSHIVAQAGEPVGRAMAELERVQGRLWWHLVVDMADGRFGAIRFSSLTSFADTAISKPRWLKHCHVLRTSSPGDRFRIFMPPEERAPRIKALWEMDLSPGTVIDPRRPRIGSSARGGSSSVAEHAWEELSS